MLKLLWDAKTVCGSAQQVPPPKNVALADKGLETQQSEGDIDGNNSDANVEDDDAVEFGQPEIDLHDRQAVKWFGKRLYLGHDTQVSQLFWLLAKKPGVAHNLGEMQRAVDRMETDRRFGDKEFKKAMNRVRKAVSKPRGRLREHELDDHVMIVKEGPNDYPSYTMICRFGKS